jgi:hypothetical protein
MKSTIALIIVSQCAVSCGWQNVARTMSGTERESSLKHIYTIQIQYEVQGHTPPEKNISWNHHWTRIIESLRSTPETQGGDGLESFIISERRKNGLPALKF